jgi:urease accessory protein
MIRLIEKITVPATAEARLTLPLQQRVKCRARVVLDDGREAGVFLPRGSTLRAGDLLRSEQGLVVEVVAADEDLSLLRSDDALLLARACYHLGNRHVPVQISPGAIRYAHDHVLDDMISGLGLTVLREKGPFEPEPGAYGGSVAGHGHHHPH